MSVPQQLADVMRADWSGDGHPLAGVRVTATERVLDRITAPTLQLRQTRITRTPSAPMSHRTVSVLCTLITSLDDVDAAAEQLDRLVWPLLDWADTRYQHDDATAVGYGGRLAYDIPLTIITAKD